MLYIKNGNEYDVYMDLGGGEFTSYGTTTKEDIEATFMPISYLGTVEEYYGSLLKKAGTETVLGRTCVKYSAGITTDALSGTFTVCFDQQTGMLMKWSTESTEGGVFYEASEFKTSGVTLPTP